MRLLFFFFAVLLYPCPIVLAEALPNAPHIVVNGNYELRTTPDILYMSLQIMDVGLDVKLAAHSVEQRSSALIKAAEKIGIQKDDLNSAQLNITPQYKWDNNLQIYTGTEVARSINLTLRDLSKYDALIKAILESNIAQINNSELSSSKMKELEALAMQKAVADAKARATMLVSGIPQKVGLIYSITATPQSSMPERAMFKVAQAANDQNSSFEPGTLTISQTVQVVFYLTSN